jgi:hypothetical protein
MGLLHSTTKANAAATGDLEYIILVLSSGRSDMA